MLKGRITPIPLNVQLFCGEMITEKAPKSLNVPNETKNLRKGQSSMGGGGDICQQIATN